MTYLDDIAENRFIKAVAERFHIKPTFIALLLVGLIGFYIYKSLTTGYLILILGIFIPAYHSFKAIETPQKEDDTRMLHYWCIFSIICVLDGFFQPGVSFSVFSGAIRLIIIAILSSGNYKGSSTMYNYFIGPIMRAFENDIETTYKNFKESMASLVKTIKGEVTTGYHEAKGVVEGDNAETKPETENPKDK